MANPNERSKTLQRFGLTEKNLAALFTSKAPAEAVWLAEHELKMHREWAEQRHDFILAEIAQHHPDSVDLPKRHRRKSPPLPDGPPIVSHRGRGGRGDSIYGESV